MGVPEMQIIVFETFYGPKTLLSLENIWTFLLRGASLAYAYVLKL